MQHLKGPDFPTGGIIVGHGGIRDAYETGRGRVVVRGRAHIEPLRQGKEAIIVTEMPYQVYKGDGRGDGSGLIKKIAEQVAERQAQGDLGPPRRVRQVGHPAGDRAEARRDPQGRPQQALQAHPAADHVRREHGRAGRRRAAHARAAADRRATTSTTSARSSCAARSTSCASARRACTSSRACSSRSPTSTR